MAGAVIANMNTLESARMLKQAHGEPGQSKYGESNTNHRWQAVLLQPLFAG
jgi:hypothetical protein